MRVSIYPDKAGVPVVTVQGGDEDTSEQVAEAYRKATVAVWKGLKNKKEDTNGR